MIDGTQYTALYTSLQSGDWDGVINIIGSAIDSATRRSAAQTVTQLTPEVLSSQVQRSLDTDFIISATRAADVTYTIELSVVGSLLVGSSHADVVLLLNNTAMSNPSNDLTSTLSLGLTITPKLRKVITAYVPAGTVCNLTSTTSGSGTATYIYGQETLR